MGRGACFHTSIYNFGILAIHVNICVGKHAFVLIVSDAENIMLYHIKGNTKNVSRIYILVGDFCLFTSPVLKNMLLSHYRLSKQLLHKSLGSQSVLLLAGQTKQTN